MIYCYVVLYSAVSLFGHHLGTTAFIFAKIFAYLCKLTFVHDVLTNRESKTNFVGISQIYRVLSKKEIPRKRKHSRGIWRSGWDSNPRAIARKLISSQPRYDHFDTAA